MKESESREYRAESAADFYAELRRCVAAMPAVETVYAGFGAMFRKLLLINTSGGEVHFSGTFARTDYLLKEHGASLSQQQMVNSMRMRMRTRGSMTADEMRRHWQSDLKALAIMVSLIYNEPVPPAIAALFPADTARKEVARLQANVWRMVVERWDEAYLYGHIDQAPGYMSRVAYTKKQEEENGLAADFSYLRPLLAAGTQLNLVRPRSADGVIKPELIVYEPDLLIDVSAVASCFAPCGTTPLHYLMGKMKPSAESPAITMGHLASQMLDDVVNAHGKEPSLRDSVAHFYSRNATEMLTSGAADRAELFWSEAEQQLSHIKDAINSQLPTTLGRFSVADIALEPSFFCETLGLQGRMDMLQLDHSMVLEQKSGKCGFPQTDPDTPVGQQQHYVQILLYMMILRYGFRDTYEKIGRRQTAFLMYSKYKNSLLALGYSPHTAAEAMQVRNHIAWMERHFATKGFGAIEKMDSSRLLIDPSKARFFANFVQSETEQLLNTVKQADPLAKAYYYRFMRFVALEHLLAKIGTPGREASGFASLWNDPLDDKLQAGNIFAGMRLVEPTDDCEGSVETIRLQFAATLDDEVSNFRTGDIVAAYPYEAGTEPDVRRQMVFRSTIASIDTNSISLRLRAPQADKRVLMRHKGSLWAVEHDMMESGYTGLYRGLHALLRAPRQRLDLILGRRQPIVDTSLQLNEDHHIGSSDFNELALRIKQSRDIYLVLGPPGSGKTSFALICAVKEELTEPDGSVLLLAYTNRAVDEICSKLDHEGIDYLRVGSSLTCAEPYRAHLLSEVAARQPKLKDLERRIMQCRVMVGTTTAMSSRVSLCLMRGFSLAVVDEASQILEPHLLPLLAAANGSRCAIGRFVMIGDHKQLPAVVKQSREESAVKDETLHRIGLMDCRESIFQRFYRLWGDRPECAAMLDRQGRMHAEIMDFPAREYYEGRLGVASLPRLVAPLPPMRCPQGSVGEKLLSHRLAFIDVLPDQESPSDKINLPEATLIAHIAHAVYAHCVGRFSPSLTLGVIVPYRNQISAVRHQIGKLYPADAALDEITIDTVERYQGSQRDFIVFGTTVSQYYQLDFLTDTCFCDTDGSLIDRKLNVALTRAREHLYILGNAALLREAPSYRRLIGYCTKNGHFIKSAEI